MTVRPYPGGRRFAFTIIDDTDVATVENIRPIYDLLASLGMRTTKTVWPLAWQGSGSNFAGSETLADPHYLEFVHSLVRQGFEIASHGATMESSARSDTMRAHEILRHEFGEYPTVYANHAVNRENIYWGTRRIDDPLVRRLYGALLSTDETYFQGEREDSAFWWGDLCSERHVYVRNLTFDAVNLLEVNPSMPYRDASRPLVKYWFSATDAEDCEEFVARFSLKNIDHLERTGGISIVATHLGKGFVTDGQVDARVVEILREIAGRNGWFAPVSESLGWLRNQRSAGTDEEIPAAEWRSAQWQWARDLMRRRLRTTLRSWSGRKPRAARGPANP